MGPRGYSQSRGPDQVGFSGRDEVGIATGHPNRQRGAGGKGAFKIDLESDSQSIKTRSEIGARAGYT